MEPPPLPVEGTASAAVHLDPFAGAPLLRPRPVGIAHVAAAGAAAMFLGLGLAGMAAALLTGATAPWLAPVPAFVGPLNTGLPVNLAHVVAGIVGLVASRHVGAARVYLLVGGVLYMALAPMELFGMRTAPGAIVIVHEDMGTSAVLLPDVAPLLHFVMGAAMVVARTAADSFDAGRS